MKRVINFVLYSVAGVIGICIAGIIIANEPLPDGEVGFEAEALADSMLQAVNEPAWGSLRYLAWTYDGKRHYVWDKWYQLVEIRTSKMRILLNTRALDGRVWRKGRQLEGAEKRKWLQRGWEYWCNDSFWFNPVVKLRDEGTVRKLVKLDSGGEALLVTYEEGGVTPGDSYLWFVGPNGLPTKWKMWTRQLPVKGAAAEWKDWVSVGGAMVATYRSVGPVKIEITNARSGEHHSDLGLDKDPFTEF